MKLTSFLAHCQKGDSLTSVTYFTGKEYPLLVCSHITAFLRKNGHDVKPLSVETLQWAQVESCLSTTFLGATQTVWLGNLSALDAKTLKKILEYISTYQGPHRIICFVNGEDLPSDKVKDSVDFQQDFSKEEIERLFQILLEAPADNFFKMMKQEYKTLSLDKILLLGYYSIVLGARTETFMRDWYEKLIVPDESLFILAQSFFGRKRDLFFRSWFSLKNSYEFPFWTTFWSEQLWCASHVVSLRRAQNFKEAKQMSGRLPFSFLQKEWEKYKPEELQRAHAFLYTVDCHLKSGGTELSLELFYAKFFEKQFYCAQPVSSL